MSRKRQAKFFMDGVLVVDKPAGPTSHDVVARLRRRFKPAKLGHCGTLDPFAKGTLILAFNNATKLTNLLGEGDKVYRATLALGRSTDTGDHTGETVEQKPVPAISASDIEAAMQSFLGGRLQTPPAYSAVKHQGKPLYAYARKGVKIEKPPRPILIHKMSLESWAEDRIEFVTQCSKGTYVRSLGEELAEALGAVGHLAELYREASLPFERKEAVSLNEALEFSPEELAAGMLDISSALARCGLPLVQVDEDQAWELRQGQIMPKEAFLTAESQGDVKNAEAFRVVSDGGELVAVLRWLKPGERRPGRDYETIRVFPEPGREPFAPAQAVSGFDVE